MRRYSEEGKRFAVNRNLSRFRLSHAWGSLHFTESKTIRHLRVGPDRFRVFFATEEDVESAEYLRAEGMLAGMTLALSGTESQTGAEAGQACSTTGDQRFAVIKVKIGNPTTANPSYATTTLSDYLFGTSGQPLSEYWNEASHGLAWASGDIYPQGPDEWYDLTSKNYSCNSADGGAYYGYPTLRSDALAAADPDVDFNNVERALIIFSKPNGLGCFAGVASIGCWLGSPDGSPSISYALQVFEYMDTRNEAVELTSHEGAHNLSLYHSSSKDYGAEPLGAPSDSGSTLEYGDRYSAVGFWNKGHYAPQHNAKIGWTSGSETITSSVVRTILPNNQSGGLEALKVKRGTEGSQNLWLEFRARQGLFYSTIVNDPSNGALIHLDNGTAQSVLLDFTPGSNNSCNSTYCLDFYDAPLTVGQTWSDPYSNLNITVNSASAAGLEVAIDYGVIPCTESPATVSVSPVSQSAEYPAAASYSITVTNNDTSACNSSVYTLTSDIRDSSGSAAVGFTLAFDSSSLSVAPGGSQSTNLTVTPSSASTVGNIYQVEATAARTDPNESTTDSAGLTVTAPTNTVSVNVSGKGSVNLNPPNQSWSSSFSQDYSALSPPVVTLTPPPVTVSAYKP